MKNAENKIWHSHQFGFGWAKTQPIVKSIIASTDKTNTSSFKVLEKNDSIKVGETETLLNWKLEIDNAAIA